MTQTDYYRCSKVNNDLTTNTTMTQTTTTMGGLHIEMGEDLFGGIDLTTNTTMVFKLLLQME